MLDDMELGVAFARKGWIRKETVINTWDVDQLMSFYENKQQEGYSVHVKTLHIVEFDKVKAQLAEYASSSLGKEKL